MCPERRRESPCPRWRRSKAWEGARRSPAAISVPIESPPDRGTRSFRCRHGPDPTASEARPRRRNRRRTSAEARGSGRRGAPDRRRRTRAGRGDFRRPAGSGQRRRMRCRWSVRSEQAGAPARPRSAAVSRNTFLCRAVTASSLVANRAARQGAGTISIALIFGPFATSRERERERERAMTRSSRHGLRPPAPRASGTRR